MSHFRDLAFRNLLLAETVVKRFFPLWTVGIRPRQEGKSWWQIEDRGIRWDVAQSPSLPHADHVEMSGLEISSIVSYGVDRRGSLRLYRHLVWPRLRTRPNNTHASFSDNFSGLTYLKATVNGKPLDLKRPNSFRFNGILEICGHESGIGWKRQLFADRELPQFHEILEITNLTQAALNIRFSGKEIVRKIPKKREHGGRFLVRRRITLPNPTFLQPGESITARISYSASDEHRPESAAQVIAGDPCIRRKDLVEEINESLVLETGDAVVDLAFSLAKLRASESIFRTKGGLMHGPGGGDFYAALWTNDQCEYVNPFFAWSGYETGLQAAMNCYRLFAHLMDASFSKPLPSSIVAEGDDIWNGAGDRGDAAMYAQGAGRFLLTSGRREWMEELLPAIDWCLEWCKKHRNNANGAVLSDSDELEGRFPSGKANLSTSSLYYDALVSRAFIARELGNKVEHDFFRQRALDYRQVIDEYFGGEVDGFATYRYFEGCSLLRSWICLPLTVGLHDRAAGTVDALFSPHLWTINGLRTSSDSETVWDRSTLFALRGALAAGATEPAWSKLKEYSRQRLLGAHAPYPFEAYPEGNRRHLSAEAGLYCRIFIEGMFGLRPTSLNTFDLQPHLPAELPFISLRKIAAFGARDLERGTGLLDLEVRRDSADRLRVRSTLRKSNNENTTQPFFDQIIREGELLHVELPAKA